MNNPQKTVVEDPTSFARFWDKFSLFPSRFENAIWGSFWYLALLAILPFLLLFVPTRIRHMDVPGYWITFLMDTKEWLLVVIGLLFVIGAYIHWQTKIPLFFKWLLDNRRIAYDHGDVNSQYLRYLENYQSALHHKWKRYIFAAVLGAVILLYGLNAPQTSFKFFLAILFWGLVTGLSAWPIFVTGKYIRMLPCEFEIAMQPAHPDKCAGLKRLGDFCFAMALPLIIGELVLALFGIGGALLLATYPDGVISGGIQLYFNQSDVIFANLVLFFIALPFTLTTFLLPLWKIHIYMANGKTKAEDEYAARALRLEQQIRTYLDQEGMLSKAKTARDQLEIMQAIHPDTLGYPIWPFSREALLKLISPQLLGVIGTMVSLYQIIVP